LVVELAAGSRILSRRVVDTGFRAFGVDPSDAMLGIARTVVPAAYLPRHRTAAEPDSARCLVASMSLVGRPLSWRDETVPHSINLSSGWMVSVLLISMVSLSGLALGDEIISREAVPTGVLEAFEKAYPSATIRGYAIAREEGQLFYEIESLEGTMTRELLYKPDGSVVEIEESIDANELPLAGQKVIRDEYPEATFTKVEKVFRNSDIGYEVKLKHGDKKIGFDFDAKGKVLESTVTIASVDLPHDAQQAIRTRYPGATISEAKKVIHNDSVEYEVDLDQGDRSITCVVGADGEVLESPE
jgi:hypothetical protein